MNGCGNTRHNRTDIESAMQHYDAMILNLDADSIAIVYTKDGNLGDIAVGRDSIKRFLSSFKNIRVLSQNSQTKTIDIIHDTAIQEGTYSQSDLIAGKDTIRVKGTYKAKWQWNMGEGWKLKYMTTKSLK